MRTDAAECELDGPRITGPTTSLKMLGGSVEGMALRSVVDWDTRGLVAACALLVSEITLRQHTIPVRVELVEAAM